MSIFKLLFNLKYGEDADVFFEICIFKINVNKLDIDNRTRQSCEIKDLKQ